MATNISAPTGALHETGKPIYTQELPQERKSNKGRKVRLVWWNIIIFAYGVYLMVTSARILTSLWAFLLYQLGGLGVIAEAHKAKWPLSYLLTMFNRLTFQHYVVSWVRNHHIYHQYLLPIIIPVYLWNETFFNAFCINWLVNSAVHLYTHKSHDRYVNLAKNPSVTVSTLRGGWRTFLWDYYKTSELGMYIFNFTNAFIEFMAKISWAYEPKTVSKEMIKGEDKEPAMESINCDHGETIHQPSEEEKEDLIMHQEDA